MKSNRQIWNEMSRCLITARTKSAAVNSKMDDKIMKQKQT